MALRTRPDGRRRANRKWDMRRECWQNWAMTSPMPSPRNSQVLQMIWDVAVATSCWPMYFEVARRLSRPSDPHLGEVLRTLTDQFVVGVNPQVNELPDSSIIGLTVAGVAACDGTEELLSAFLDLLNMAAQRSSGFTFAGRELAAGGQVSLTDSEFTRQSRVPRLRRSRLSRLLFLLLESEPLGLTNLSGPDAYGHWNVTFDEVSIFADVRNLDDYWSKRRSWRTSNLDDYSSMRSGGPKPWIHGNVPPQGYDQVRDRFHMPLQLVIFDLTEDEKQKARLITDPGLLADVLLEWIYVRAAGRVTNVVFCEQFRPDIDLLIINDALHQLESDERVRQAAADSTHAPPHVMLTEAGAAHVEKCRTDWNNPVFRDRAARNSLLAFVHEKKGTTNIHLPQDFLSSPRSAVDGHVFSSADVLAASHYLLDKNLILGFGRFGSESIARPTGNGYDCIEQGGDVAEYLNRLEGVDVRILMMAIVQALPALGLDNQEQEDAEETANQITSEVQQGRSDQSRLTHATRRMSQILTKSAQQALATVLTGVIDYELSKLGLPPAR